MKRDIESRDDLVQLLEAFYTKAFADELIGHFFTKVVPLNLEVHIPVIADFWEAIIFNKHTYKKNVMVVHQHIHHLSHIKKEHLDRWVQIFTGTVDEMFEGDKATLIKQRGSSIATLMDIKLNHHSINKLP
jgi:hemoglobin